jgi:hypothetical protein
MPDFVSSHHAKLQSREIKPFQEYPKWIDVGSERVLARDAEHEAQLVPPPAPAPVEPPAEEPDEPADGEDVDELSEDDGSDDPHPHNHLFRRRRGPGRPRKYPLEER